VDGSSTPQVKSQPNPASTCAHAAALLAYATPHHSDVEVAFPSAARAALALAVMEVDEELQPTKVTKAFAVQGPVLRV
jgi:hypothetical protein